MPELGARADGSPGACSDTLVHIHPAPQHVERGGRFINTWHGGLQKPSSRRFWRGTALLWLGVTDEALAALKTSLALAEGPGPPPALLAAPLQSLWLAYLKRGEFDLSHGYAERGAALAEAHADTGDAAGAEEVADLALTRARRTRNRLDGVEALRVRAKILSMLGHTEEATAALEEALSWARLMPYPYAEARILCEYGMLHLRGGEPGRARKRFSAALGIFGRLGAKKDVEQAGQALRALDLAR